MAENVLRDLNSKQRGRSRPATVLTAQSANKQHNRRSAAITVNRPITPRRMLIAHGVMQRRNRCAPTNVQLTVSTEAISGLLSTADTTQHSGVKSLTITRIIEITRTKL